MEKTMNLLKYLLPCALAACGFAASMHADDFSTTVEERETDVKALAEFVKSKGQITIQEKGGNLMVSGDVRGEWDHIHTRTRGHDERGHGSANLVPPVRPHAPFPTNEFAIEVNLMLDYRADRSWASIQFQFDNPMGIRETDKSKFAPAIGYVGRNTMFGSGVLSNIAMRKAYLGYNILEEGTQRFDVEIGRRRLRDVYDSKIEFHNFFDGVTLKYANSFEGLMDMTAKASAFVIDSSVNHFGYVGELGFLNIADEGVDFKYSYIHWSKDGVNRLHKKHARGTMFNVSQFLLAYNLSPDYLPKKTQVYGAYLINHDGHGNHFTHGKKARDAFYVGFRMGEIKRQNDWAIEANYQWVRAQAIPESDCSGIGRDNPRGISFYAQNHGTSQGFANYKGYTLDGLYALTDNITFNANYYRIHQESIRIGGHHRSWGFELAAIYAF